MIRVLAACWPLMLACAAGSAFAQERASASLAATSPAGAGACLAQSEPPMSLTDLVERAWQLSRQETAKAARSDELAARESATRALFAGAPSVGLDLRRDLPRPVRLPGTDIADERGKNEWEPGFAAPLWLPGQRDAQRRVIERDRSALAASGVLARWQLAGEVRDAVWRLQASQTERALQQVRLDGARAIEADVLRRQRGGDLARADLWLSQGETRAAQAALIEARAREDEARLTLAALTGVETPLGDVAETPAAPPEAVLAATAAATEDGVTAEHPALRASAGASQAARERLAYANRIRRDNPVFGVVGRFDRDAGDVPYRNTVRMGVSFPLDTAARNAPRIAAAAAELAEAQVALEREVRQVSAERRRAAVALTAARTALTEQIERARLARDTFEAIERAFRAGERALPELLRIRALMLDAELARDLARNQVGAAIARLNQALGVTP